MEVRISKDTNLLFIFFNHLLSTRKKPSRKRASFIFVGGFFNIREYWWQINASFVIFKKKKNTYSFKKSSIRSKDMIKFDNVSKAYTGDDYVVSQVNLEIKEGEFFVIIGPSGSGKTTLLKMINRLIPLTKGYIYVKDEPIDHYNIQELRWNMGYVLQQIALFPNMTVEENIRTVPEMKKWSEEKMHERVSSLLESVGLDPESYRHRKTSELSGGEQQRIGVLRAFAADPDMILMDEPFSALDPISRKSLQNDLIEMHKEYNKTIVFVTHDMQEATMLASRMALMEKGEIVQVGTPEEIIEAPKNDFVRKFLASGHIESDKDEKIEAVIEANYLLALDSKEEFARALYKEDKIDDLILELSKEEAVLIKDADENKLGKVDKNGLLSYLATEIKNKEAE